MLATFLSERAWREAGPMGASSGVGPVSREFWLGYRLAASLVPKSPYCENEKLPSPSGPWAVGYKASDTPPSGIGATLDYAFYVQVYELREPNPFTSDAGAEPPFHTSLGV